MDTSFSNLDCSHVYLCDQQDECKESPLCGDTCKMTTDKNHSADGYIYEWTGVTPKKIGIL